MAKQLEQLYNTIKNEVNRRIVLRYYGKQKRYKADEGERVYRENRRNSRK